MEELRRAQELCASEQLAARGAKEDALFLANKLAQVEQELLEYKLFKLKADEEEEIGRSLWKKQQDDDLMDEQQQYKNDNDLQLQEKVGKTFQEEDLGVNSPQMMATQTGASLPPTPMPKQPAGSVSTSPLNDTTSQRPFPIKTTSSSSSTSSSAASSLISPNKSKSRNTPISVKGSKQHSSPSSPGLLALTKSSKFKNHQYEDEDEMHNSWRNVLEREMASHHEELSEMARRSRDVEEVLRREIVALQAEARAFKHEAADATRRANGAESMNEVLTTQVDDLNQLLREQAGALTAASFSSSSSSSFASSSSTRLFSSSMSGGDGRKIKQFGGSGEEGPSNETAELSRQLNEIKSLLGASQAFHYQPQQPHPPPHLYAQQHPPPPVIQYPSYAGFNSTTPHNSSLSEAVRLSQSVEPNHQQSSHPSSVSRPPLPPVVRKTSALSPPPTNVPSHAKLNSNRTIIEDEYFENETNNERVGKKPAGGERREQGLMEGHLVEEDKNRVEPVDLKYDSASAEKVAEVQRNFQLEQQEKQEEADRRQVAQEEQQLYQMEQMRLAKEAEEEKERLRLEQELAKEAEEEKERLRLEQLRLAIEAEEEKERLRLEQERLAKQAEEEKETLRLEQERLAKQAEDEKERLRLEQLRLAKEAEVEKERLRLELAKEAEEEKERLRLEQERLAKEAEVEKERLRLEQERLAKEAEEEKERLRLAAIEKEENLRASQELEAEQLRRRQERETELKLREEKRQEERRRVALETARQREEERMALELLEKEKARMEAENLAKEKERQRIEMEEKEMKRLENLKLAAEAQVKEEKEKVLSAHGEFFARAEKRLKEKRQAEEQERLLKTAAAAEDVTRRPNEDDSLQHNEPSDEMEHSIGDYSPEEGSEMFEVPDDSGSQDGGEDWDF